MPHITAGKKYLLHWRRNPFYWNRSLREVKKDRYTVRQKGRFYTIVEAHFTGDFNVVDCTCDFNDGSYYPINTELLRMY